MAIKTAFIGLGVMGFPMAGHLATAGHRVTVFNRTAARAEVWRQACGAGHDVALADTPRAAATGADFVFACVGADKDVRDIAYGDVGVLAGLKPGAVFIDHTTASADLAREMAAAIAERGGAFLDAPVSGGQAGAENGTLTVMVGGDEAAFTRAEPVMKAYARMVKRLGPAGAGQLAKMVNQICIAGIVEGLAEALHFGLEAGLDMAAVVDVISKGAAQSWQMDNRAGTMIEGHFDFGFAVNWMRKDLAMCLDEAGRLGLDLPITEMVDRFYAEVQGMGGGRWDTSSLIARFRPAEKGQN